jgi:hypothetical protein
VTTAPRADKTTMLSGEFAHWAILDAALRPEAVPVPGADWPEVNQFALSFDGYAYRGDQLGGWANQAVKRFQRSGTPSRALALPDLRALLFFVQRRFHHFGTSPDDGDRAYIDALLMAIRARVP